MADAEPKSDAPELPPAALAALQRGSKIEAIKIVREELHIGLREAKDAVDDYVRRTPALHARLAAAQSEANRTALLWLAALIAVATLVYHWLAGD